jgi:hypothetical protein
MLAGTEAVQDLLNISELKDAKAGLNFQGTGKLGTPVGANLLHVPDVPSKTVVGLDSTCALEMVQAGDIVTDYDKLIDRQLERASISMIAGFTKIFGGAVKTLTYQA